MSLCYNRLIKRLGVFIMYIRVGDVLRSNRSNNYKYKIVSEGSSFGYNIEIKGKLIYDVETKFIEDGLNGLSRSELRYQIKSGDTKVMDNGEKCSIVRKEETGGIVLKFENGKVLKFVSTYAYTSGYATSERVDGKEYDIEIGEVVKLSGDMTGVVTKINYRYITILVENRVEIDFPIHTLGARDIWILTKSALSKLLVGEKRDASEGVVAEITDVSGIKDVTVTFSNGLVRHMTYNQFLTTENLMYERPSYINTRVWQEKEQMYATAIKSTGKHKDVFLIKFDDGTTVRAQRRSFLEGKSTKNPKKVRPIQIGECHKQANGLYATVISINEDNKENGDIELSNGVILHNYLLKRVRRGNLPKSSKAMKDIEKYRDKVYTIGNLYYEVLERDRKNILIRWNGFYLEVRGGCTRSRIKMPLLFRPNPRYINYKNITVDKIEADSVKECFYAYGTCNTCGKKVKVVADENGLGHNCYENVSTDYFGLDIDVRQTKPYVYEVKYRDNTKNVLDLSNNRNFRILVHKELYARSGKSVFINGTGEKVLDMYFDEIKKKYVCLVELNNKRYIKVLS